jgi:hypothetical protein
MKTNRGSALLLTTILMFVILSMVVSLTYVTVMEQKMSQKTKSSVGAFYGAESGVEWALNQIATTTNPDTTLVQSKFGLAANGSKACPFVGCDVYFLDKDGKVILPTGILHVDDIKAVRSVGTNGNETQRAIEAAVAAGGGPGSWECQIVNSGSSTADCPVGTKLITGGCLIPGTGATNNNNPVDNSNHTGSWFCNGSSSGGALPPSQAFAWCCK